MANRYPNHRLVKLHRSHTIEEIATLFGIHRNTVRNWIKAGLPILDDRKPLLVQGQTLVDFLIMRRKRAKRPCGPGRLFCLRCRIPKIPRDGRVIYQPRDEHRGRLVGTCPDCGTRLFRHVGKGKLASSLGELKLHDTMAWEHIAKSSSPIVNCDFNQGQAHHA